MREPEGECDSLAIDLGFGREDLQALFDVRMPFGRFRGQVLIDLPEEYLLWFERRDFPAGNLGRWMKLSLGIKRYGAEPAVKAVRRRLQGVSREPWDEDHRLGTNVGPSP